MLDVKNALLLFALAGGCASQALAYDFSTKQSTDAAFSPGDTLKINVLEEKELSQYYTIDTAGMILFPMLGRLHVAGKTEKQVQDTLTYLLKDGYILEPIISVNALKKRDFYILGAIKNPGHYALPANAATILNAVALAGGFQPDANTEKFEIVRKEQDKDPHSTKTSAYANILPGDIIIVNESFF